MSRQSKFPQLKMLTVEEPCPADWSGMEGDDKRRFCSQCQHHVVNLSAMTAREAEEVLEKAEGRLCVRYETKRGRIQTLRRPGLLLGFLSALATICGSVFGQQKPQLQTGRAFVRSQPKVARPFKNYTTGKMKKKVVQTPKTKKVPNKTTTGIASVSIDR